MAVSGVAKKHVSSNGLAPRGDVRDDDAGFAHRDVRRYVVWHARFDGGWLDGVGRDVRLISREFSRLDNCLHSPEENGFRDEGLVPGFIGSEAVGILFL